MPMWKGESMFSRTKTFLSGGHLSVRKGLRPTQLISNIEQLRQSNNFPPPPHPLQTGWIWSADLKVKCFVSYYRFLESSSFSSITLFKWQHSIYSRNVISAALMFYVLCNTCWNSCLRVLQDIVTHYTECVDLSLINCFGIQWGRAASLPPYSKSEGAGKTC